MTESDDAWLADETFNGPEELRACVRSIDWQNESFNSRFTAEQLLQLWRVQRKIDWDYFPDQWSERQVEEALQGKVPRWDSNGKPMYDLE